MFEVKVARLEAAQTAEGLALVDPEVVARTGIAAESLIVELRTHRGKRLISRIAPYPPDMGSGLVRLDRYQLQSLKPDLHESIQMTPVQAPGTKRLVLEPMAPISSNLNSLEKELGENLNRAEQPVCKGMVLSLKIKDFARKIRFRVISADPEPSVVNQETRVLLRTSRLLPGLSANLVTFDDVGGLQTQIEQIRELVECPLRHPEVYDHLGIEAPRGILFFGPPGVGKTYLAKAIANEIGAHFLYINGPEIVSSVHGGTEANLRRIFEEATEHSPSIVMIDELDAIVPHRDESGSQADVRCGAQLLSLLDGLISLEAVVVIGTTNRPNSLDPALRRPGRLDREIFIPPPNAQAREEILNVHTRRVPLDHEAITFLPELARMTHGFVGADLMELVRQAALNALRGTLQPDFSSRSGVWASLNQIAVKRADFVSALKKVSPSALRETPVSIPDTTWEDIGGLAKVIEQLKEAVELPLLYPEAFRRLKIETSTGVLLYGPPGTGKTILAKAVARECGANFIAISGPEIFGKWLGQSEERIRHVFQMARQVAPTVVFFDQLDGIGSQRAGNPGNGARDRVVNQLLAEMDGIHELSQIIVLGATNQIDVLDAALLRQGRFGLQIHVGLPDAEGRKAILDLLLSKLPLDQTTDWPGVVQEVAQRSDGLSGAALSFLCERAKLQALREGNYRTDISVSGAHLRTALDRVLTERSKSEHSAAPRLQPQSSG